METTVKLYTLSYKQSKTYLTAALFVLGNIILPQLFHLIPQGGVTWLPIYFFTLTLIPQHYYKIFFLST